VLFNFTHIGIIQYIFKNGPVLTRDLLKIHANSKENGNLFSRTFQTTKNKIQSTDIPINEFRSLIIDEHGGLDQIDNNSVLPRNYDQIYYERTKHKEKLDNLTRLFYKKLSISNSSIHYTQCVPELEVVLFTNQQKIDIE
jgi:hypothetical protein